MVRVLQGDASGYNIKPEMMGRYGGDLTITVLALSVNPAGELLRLNRLMNWVPVYEEQPVLISALQAALLPIFTQTIQDRYEDLKAYLSVPETKEELKGGFCIDIWGPGNAWLCDITNARLTEDDEIVVIKDYPENSITLTESDTYIINTLWNRWRKIDKPCTV